MQNLLDDLSRGKADHPGFAMLLASGLPGIKAQSSWAEVTAGPGNMAAFLRVAQYTDFALNHAFLIGHWVHPPSCRAAKWKVPRVLGVL